MSLQDNCSKIHFNQNLVYVDSMVALRIRRKPIFQKAFFGCDGADNATHFVLGAF